MPNFISISDATKRLATAERVLVIGCSGAGKSTISLKIAEHFNLEYLSLDRDVIWLPEWTMRKRGDQREILKKLVSRKRWVMDGTSPETFDIRVPRADLVIWLRVPRRVSLMGLARRVLKNYGSVRNAMADGCPERLPDREFLTYIWTFEQKMTPRIIDALNQHGPDVPVVTPRSRKEAEALLGV